MSGSIDRIEMGKKFLRETVFASREKSHGPGAEGGCGLGSGPVLPESLTPTQKVVLEQICGHDVDAALMARVGLRVEAWIKLQDALDRRRNHFIKGFRQEHGTDRKAWSAEQQAAYTAGLAAINADNEAKLEAHARELAAILAPASR